MKKAYKVLTVIMIIFSFYISNLKGTLTQSIQTPGLDPNLYYFYNKEGEIINAFPLNRIKHAAPLLYTQAQNQWQDSNYLVVDDLELSTEALSYITTYINFYGHPDLQAITKKITRSNYALELFYIADQWHCNKLKKEIIKYLPKLALKHNLYAEFQAETLEDITHHLHLNPYIIRPVLSKQDRYYPYLLTQLKTIAENNLLQKLIISNNSKYIAWYCEYNILKVYDLSDHAIILTTEYDEQIKGLEFSKKSDSLVCYGDNTIKIYNIDQKSYQTLSFKDTTNISSINYSFDSKYLSIYCDNQVSLYNIATNKIVAVLDHTRNSMSTPVLSPDSNHLAFVSHENHIQLYNISINTTKTIINQSEIIHTLHFSDNNKYIACLAGTAKNILFIYDINEQKIKNTVKVDPHIHIRDITFSPNSSRLALCLGRATMSIYDIENATSKLIFRHGNPISFMAFSPDSKYVVTLAQDDPITLHNIDDKTYTTHHFCIDSTNLCFSPDSKYLAFCSSDEYVKLYDIAARRTACIDSEADCVDKIFFSTNSQGGVLSICAHNILKDENILKVYDRETNKFVNILYTPHKLTHFALSNDNHFIVTAFDNGSVVISGSTAHLSNQAFFNLIQHLEKERADKRTHARTLNNNFMNYINLFFEGAKSFSSMLFTAS